MHTYICSSTKSAPYQIRNVFNMHVTLRNHLYTTCTVTCSLFLVYSCAYGSVHNHMHMDFTRTLLHAHAHMDCKTAWPTVLEPLSCCFRTPMLVPFRPSIKTNRASASPVRV